MAELFAEHIVPLAEHQLQPALRIDFLERHRFVRQTDAERAGVKREFHFLKIFAFVDELVLAQNIRTQAALEQVHDFANTITIRFRHNYYLLMERATRRVDPTDSMFD